MDGRRRLKTSASSSTDQIYVKHLGFPGGTTDVELILETLSDYHLSSPGRLDDIFKVGGGDRWKNKGRLTFIVKRSNRCQTPGIPRRTTNEELILENLSDNHVGGGSVV